MNGDNSMSYDVIIVEEISAGGTPSCVMKLC